MEFLPPADADPTISKSSDSFTRVRLAWYYRPGDVSERTVADNRVLLAAIYSEVCDITQLRSKCHVIHRDKISDLAGWKKRPDRFYFTRLFDPYIKKEFEVIPSTAVKNVPPEVREPLISRYEYVVAEKEVVSDLIDDIRLCETCRQWTPNPEAVQCDRCKKYFHMGCVSPPLASKPSRGYGWTCAPCAQEHNDVVVDNHGPRHGTPGGAKPRTTVPATRGRGRPRKDRAQAEREENMEIKHFRMWPFRYFGQYTVAQDTIDEDDFIFPRAATRVGAKYQATVPPAPGPSSIPIPTPDMPERGGDDTIEVLSMVVHMKEEHVEKHKDWMTMRLERLHQVAWLTEAIRRLSEAWMIDPRKMSAVDMRNPVRVEKWKKTETRCVDKDFSIKECAAFEEAMKKHGAELRAVRDEVRTRTMPEIVRYYGVWKNGKLREEHRLKDAGHVVKKEDTIQSDDEGSIVKRLTKGNSNCAACRTKESPVWWKAPKGLATNVLCDNCGMGWRKYADLNVRAIREDPPPSTTKGKAAENKRDGTPLTAPPAKRARVSSTPPPNVPHLRCVACKRNGPVGKVLKCQQCGFQCHAGDFAHRLSGCCGASIDPAKIDTWVCDLCENVKSQESSLNTHCILCPRVPPAKRQEDVNPPSDSYFRALKPTEGQNWAHVLCAVFAPETSFTDVERLRLIEGISAIPPSRWFAECSICHSSGGASFRCFDCTREFHISCAWKAGYSLGFEFVPVSDTHKNRDVVVSFRGETGFMSPVIRCPQHSHDKTQREIFGLCEMDDNGETALQVYCKNYKRVQTDQSYGLLRKARRLDDLLTETDPQVNGQRTPADDSGPSCASCHTRFSPSFHPTAGNLGSGSLLCHKCYFKPPNGVNGDASVAIA
ncbi:hypothetical protein PUNSTDRAFT_77480 [Punctularia strigosozonata HHB-11173 SS5]|uniref:BAH-domain-containing protein n=1 Tax=Punctularia strigosozonata (strain HHB-11173) TaxID=741275 RepID=R7S1V7_PUNST|nr:uncharacterized protein PUNSTDRAFT_77480 [Punctularia strigosozonata HHB-11173 SS5]EIN03844.1 hypothetical protein PUNSTDRAFT_77480 [Punctularia strigosozonata HHB-11173 SS5]